jgi:enoyl-CoA hydratase/carnithine racemase
MSVVTFEKINGLIGLVRINRPDALNALNLEVRKKLSEIFNVLNNDENIKVTIITGNEKAFAAGADIKEMVGLSSVDMYLKKMHLLWEPITKYSKPLIAAVNGYALGGGCELAIHADIIVAGENAKFGQPEIKIGIMPGAGGTQRLPRATGKFKAMRYLLTGEMFSGKDAFEMGLVSYCVKDEEVMNVALEVAEKIAKMSAIAVSQIKEVVNKGYDINLDAALTLEREAFVMLFSTEDQKEGMKAFIEKRKPEYKGR